MSLLKRIEIRFLVAGAVIALVSAPVVNLRLLSDTRIVYVAHLVTRILGLPAYAVAAQIAGSGSAGLALGTSLNLVWYGGLFYLIGLLARRFGTVVGVVLSLIALVGMACLGGATLGRLMPT